jgi:hypothetical protein
MDFKRVCVSVMGEVLCSVITEFGIPMKLVRQIKLFLNATYRRVWVGKHFSDMFSVKNGLKQGNALSALLFNSSLEYALTRFTINQDGLKLNGTYWCLFMLMMLTYWAEMCIKIFTYT